MQGVRPVPTGTEQLEEELVRLGIRAGDAVMVHASLRAVGLLVGGPNALIDALDRAVGEHGGVLMVLGAENRWGWVTAYPESEQPALLADAEPFDATRTPADADVGVLAELFRRRAGTRVTAHPEGRFGARGALAATLLAEPPWDDYYGPGSPLAHLVELGGKVLRLGADPNTVTVLHYAEYLAEIPGKRRVRRLRLVSSTDGPRLRTVDSLDDSDGIVEYEGEDYFTTILLDWLETGEIGTGRVGQASAELIDAAPLVAHAVRWMERTFGRPANPSSDHQGTRPSGDASRS